MKRESLHIEHVKNQISELEKKYQESEGYLLEFSWDQEGKIGEIKGNISGLLYLAASILDVANSNIPGKHIHFDGSSGFVEGSDSIVISKEQ